MVNNFVNICDHRSIRMWYVGVSGRMVAGEIMAISAIDALSLRVEHLVQHGDYRARSVGIVQA